MREPDFMTGADFRGYGGELHREFLDQGWTDRGLELRGEFFAANQTRTIEANVEITQDVSRLQAACPLFKLVQMTGRVGAANDGANRGADHDIRNDAICDQRPDDADMGKAARRTTAEREPDNRPPYKI